MSSRIEQIIEEIEDYIDSCKGPLFGGGDKIVVDRERMEELLRELRMKTPEEIKRYQKILRQREEILDDAEQKAAAILSDAQEQYKALVEEHAIMQEAYQQAEITVREANEQADQCQSTGCRDWQRSNLLYKGSSGNVRKDIGGSAGVYQQQRKGIRGSHAGISGCDPAK